MAKMGSINGLKDQWIFDSGATSNMVNSMEGLYNVKTCNETIEYGKESSNSHCNVKGSLDIIIKNKNGTENQVTLSEVYYINELS